MQEVKLNSTNKVFSKNGTQCNIKFSLKLNNIGGEDQLFLELTN